MKIDRQHQRETVILEIFISLKKDTNRIHKLNLRIQNGYKDVF